MRVLSRISSPATFKRRRWWLPSFSQFIWLAFFLGLVLTQWRLVLISADGDACLHWRIGNWMIQHHTVIRFDAFSYTRGGAPLISKEWLGEVLFAAMGDFLGWNGIVLLAAMLIATTLWLLHRQLLAEGHDLLISTALVLAAALACSVHWLARPLLFTHILAVIFAWQLRWFHLDRLRAPKLLFRLVPLMLLWVNLHGAFFTGFVIIGTFLVGTSIALLRCRPTEQTILRRKFGVLVLLTTACGLVTFLNPNGWKLPLHVLEFFHDPTLAHYTNEFRSPNFHSAGAHGLLLEFGLLAFILLVLQPRLSTTDIVVIGVWGLLALFAARNIPIFALMITPSLAACWQKQLENSPARNFFWYRQLSANLTQINRTADGRIVTLCSVGLLLVIAAKPRLVGGNPVLTTDVLSNRFPIVATAFINSHPDAVKGEMFNDYGWGGYLIFAMPDHKVFIDGRNDFYGAAFVREFDRANRALPGWDAVLKRYNVGWTILPRTHALNSLLAISPGWRLVYTDEVTAVYGRASGP
ncbi:MAG TPA: hypothetical protein VL171_13470 [Verrucomicrobiae bacterium]|nr:hypothetical protein [Verrucomicrobiae bacterium]